MRPLLLGAALTALAGCSPQGTPRDPAVDPNANALDSEIATVINIQDRTEIQILKERVENLEREVGEMKANPQTLDLELLTKRVENLEAASAGAASLPSQSPTASPRTPQTDPEAAQRAVDAAITERRTRRTKSD